MDAAARQALASHGAEMLRAAGVRSDAEEPEPQPEQEDWAALLALLLFAFGLAVSGSFAVLGLERAIAQRSLEIDAFHERDIRAIVRKAYGVALPFGAERWRLQVLRSWTEQGVTVARSFPEQYAARLRSELTAAVIERRGLRDLNVVVSETTAVARRRAAFVARNEVGSLVARLTAQRHRDLGVRSFIWRTMLDERVRPTHRAREGEEFFYDRPGPRPGAEPNCRCHAAAVLPGLSTEMIRGLG